MMSNQQDVFLIVGKPRKVELSVVQSIVASLLGKVTCFRTDSESFAVLGTFGG